MIWSLALWAFPFAAFLFARRYAADRLWQLTGLAWGAVISPAAIGLYALYYTGSIAALFGMLGLPLVLIHQGPGYDLAISLGLAQPGTVVKGTEHLYVELLNAAVWSVVYATLGSLADWSRATKKVTGTV